MHHRLVLGAVLVALFATLGHAEDMKGCEPAVIGKGQVSAVPDGRTLQLTDGREVRLAGIEAPQRGEAKPKLAALVAGREVSLRRMGPETDRYGRVLALVAVSPAAAGPSVQETLLAQGQAQAAAKIGHRGCATAFLAAERTARAAGLGLWADPYYVMKKAEDPAGILAVRGRFAVVEGKVLSVRESGGTIYVNFGRRFTDDFTVTVLKRHERMFTAAGLELKKLAGQQVRVRGTIEERGGPWIEAVAPEQIEIAERNRAP